MSRAIYPGSFDPVTFGHLDIIKRSTTMFDEVIVGILNNSAKKPLFTVEERMEMLKEATKEFQNVKVICFDGLLVDYMKKNDISIIVRGLRAITDFDYELQIAQSNRKVSNDCIDTVFLATSVEYAYLSSSMAKEVAMYGGDISEFLDPVIAKRVQEKYQALQEDREGK